jgi:hypothetical protein
MEIRPPIDYEDYGCTSFGPTEGKKYAKTVCFDLRDNAFVDSKDIYQVGISLQETEDGWLATYCHESRPGQHGFPRHMRHCPFCGGSLKNF